MQHIFSWVTFNDFKINVLTLMTDHASNSLYVYLLYMHTMHFNILSSEYVHTYTSSGWHTIDCSELLPTTQSLLKIHNRNEVVNTNTTKQ